jgi:hypothetical protein
MFVLIAQALCLFSFHGIHSDLSLLPLSSKTTVNSSHPLFPYFQTLISPIIRFEPNGSQTLLLYDDASEDLKIQGWVMFLKKF